MRQLIALASLAVLITIAGCGGGNSGSSGGTGPTGPANNVVAMMVDSGPNGNSVNTPFVSVTVCSPTSASTCETVDHIEVDTASYGLRIISSVLPASFTLPASTDANGDATYECAVFGDGYSWGSVREATVQVSGETATDIPIQIIGDAVSGTPPDSCSTMGTTNENTVASFGANGIIGVGPFITDDQFYYVCPSNSCSEITPLVEVSNPVASFSGDNNGVIVELPSVPAAGATSLTGSLVFGIGTQGNNGLATATIYTVDNNGTLSITYNSNTYSGSIIDSGSNANYIIDNSIPTCSGFYCPTSTLALMATSTGVNGTSNTVGFSVANAETLFNSNPSGVAFNNLGAPNTFGNFMDFGLPFFFGVHVYTAIEDANTPGGAGPYVAF